MNASELLQKNRVYFKIVKRLKERITSKTVSPTNSLPHSLLNLNSGNTSSYMNSMFLSQLYKRCASNHTINNTPPLALFYFNYVRTVLTSLGLFFSTKFVARVIDYKFN